MAYTLLSVSSTGFENFEGEFLSLTAIQKFVRANSIDTFRIIQNKKFATTSLGDGRSQLTRTA